MKRSYIVMNLLLLVSTTVLGYELRSQWKEYQAIHNMALLTPGRGDNKTNVKVRAESGLVPSYAAIVDNNLFSADRTNIIPPEAPAESVKAAVPKPVLLGTMQ